MADKVYKKLSELKDGEEFYVVAEEPFIATADKVETTTNDFHEMVIHITTGKLGKKIECPWGKETYEVKDGFVMVADKELFIKTIMPAVKLKVRQAKSTLEYYNKLMEW